MAEQILQLRGVEKGFPGTPVLRGVDLEHAAGQTLVLLGRSGVGKTVLMKLLAGLLRPDRGDVIIDGIDIGRASRTALDAHWQKLGILFQAGALFDSMTAFENVALPLRERLRLDEGEVKRRVRRALEVVDLEDAEEQFPSELSGGMQKRLAFARAVVLEPRILLYDEPTAGLDPITSAHVRQVIEHGREELGATAIVVTSDLALAFRVADAMAFLHDGRIVEHGSPEEFSRSEHPAVKAFLRTWAVQHAEQFEETGRPFPEEAPALH